jgi:hypothetical protein
LDEACLGDLDFGRNQVLLQQASPSKSANCRQGTHAIGLSIKNFLWAPFRQDSVASFKTHVMIPDEYDSTFLHYNAAEPRALHSGATSIQH